MVYWVVAWRPNEASQGHGARGGGRLLPGTTMFEYTATTDQETGELVWTKEEPPALVESS